MKLMYSRDAINDLKRLQEFLRKVNPFAARRAALDIREGAERLKQFPEIGLKVLSAPNPDLIRDLYIGQYTLRYLIREQEIIVLRIWHNKEEVEYR